MLHYVLTSRYFATSDDVIVALRKYIADFEKHERFLTKERWVMDMTEDGRLQTACERAKRLIPKEHESFSNIWKLFERLEKEGKAGGMFSQKDCQRVSGKAGGTVLQKDSRTVSQKRKKK